MRGELTVIKSTGAIFTCEMRDPIPLEDLQKAVGGNIEIVPHFTHYNGDEAYVFCNEEGKLHDLPFNEVATNLWMECLMERYSKVTRDHLVGDIAIVTGNHAFLCTL
jgi:hypothetical protein